MNQKFLETLTIDKDLTLQQLHPNEAGRVFELTEKNRAYLEEFMPWPKQTKTVEDSLAHIHKTIQKREEGETFGYGIRYDGVIVGNISLMHLNENARPEIGYWIDSEHSGKGITTRAVRALTEYAFQALDIEKIIIRADPRNIGSNKVAENSGYTLTGEEIEDGDTLNVWSINR